MQTYVALTSSKGLRSSQSEVESLRKTNHTWFGELGVQTPHRGDLWAEPWLSDSMEKKEVDVMNAFKQKDDHLLMR